MLELSQSEWLVQVHSLADGLIRGHGKIIGHIPVPRAVEKSLSWDDSPFDGKFYFREDPVVSAGQRETTPEEIVQLRAQPAALTTPFGAQTALNEILLHGRRDHWLNPEESQDPFRDRKGTLV